MFARLPSAKVVLLLVLMAGGVAARFVNLQYPAQFIFDEHHFVENARNYLAHRGDWNDHPPLGKLVLASSMRVLGDNPWGWRLPPLVLGLLTIAVAGFAAARLFRNREAGLIAAAFVAADGAVIAYSRTAVLDGQIVFLQALALLVVTRRWNLLTAVAAGVVLPGVFEMPNVAQWLQHPKHPMERVRIWCEAERLATAVPVRLRFSTNDAFAEQVVDVANVQNCFVR